MSHVPPSDSQKLIDEYGRLGFVLPPVESYYVLELAREHDMTPFDFMCHIIQNLMDILQTRGDK